MEDDSGDESVTDVGVAPTRRLETNVVVARRTQLEVPSRNIPPPSVYETLRSGGEDESEESEEESLVTARDSVFTPSTDRVYIVVLTLIFNLLLGPHAIYDTTSCM